MNKCGVSGQEKRGRTNERKRSNEGFLDGVKYAGNEVIVVGSFWIEWFLSFLYLRVPFVHDCRSKENSTHPENSSLPLTLLYKRFHTDDR